MPRIPLPEISSVQPAVVPGARPADQSARFRGQAALAQGIGEAGNVIQEFALRSQAIQNEAALSRGRVTMQKVQAAIQADIEASPDPETWDGIVERRMQEASGTIFAGNESLAPVVRRQLESDFSAWANRMTLTVRNQAQRQRNAEADAVMVAEQALRVADADLGGAIAVVDRREQLGLISPARAQIERVAVAREVDEQAVSRDIIDDPFIALERLQDTTEGGKPRFYKQLSERDRLAAIRSAKNAMETARAETVQRLQEDILQTGGVGAEEKINSWLEAGRILPSQALALKRFAAGQRGPVEMAAEGARLWQQALDLDRADPDYIQRSMQIRAAAHTLDPTVRDPIIDALNAKDDNNVREDVQRVYDLLNRDFRANAFGNVQTWTQREIDDLSSRERRAAGEPKEGDPKDPEAFREASARLFRYQRALRDFLQRHPDATTEEIFAERARLTATDRQAVLAGVVFDALSGTAAP